MEIYLDNSATTRALPEAADKVREVMLDKYGNPSSMHNKGVEAEKIIKEAKEKIAKTLKVSDKEILFTSGGTESDNLALLGCARANRRRGNHIITTTIEHPAVLRTTEQLIKEGFEVTYLNVDRNGLVNPESLKSAITDNTILVSVMHVNNEIGAIEPIEELGAAIKGINEEIIFHTDAVQGYGKIPLYPKKAKVDLVSISGHKIHGPKGTGVLYISDKLKINPIIFGGGQQGNLRSGTENVPGIAGIAVAAERLYAGLSDDAERLYELKKYFINEITKIDDVNINGVPDINGEGISLGAPHIISVSIKGIRSEVMLHALEDKGIYVSSGSACASHKKSVSDTLSAIGLEKALLDSTIRVSMSVFTQKEDIDYTLEAAGELIPLLRRYS